MASTLHLPSSTDHGTHANVINSSSTSGSQSMPTLTDTGLTPLQMQTDQFSILKKQIEQVQKSLEEQLGKQQQDLMNAILKNQIGINANLEEHLGKQQQELVQEIAKLQVRTEYHGPPSSYPSLIGEAPALTAKPAIPLANDKDKHDAELRTDEAHRDEDSKSCLVCGGHGCSICRDKGHEEKTALPTSEDNSKDASTSNRMIVSVPEEGTEGDLGIADSPSQPPVGVKRGLARSSSKAIHTKAPAKSTTAVGKMVDRLKRKETQEDPKESLDLDVVEIEDEENQPCLLRFLRGKKFDILIGFVIVLNALMMAGKGEYEGVTTAKTLGRAPDTQRWESADSFFNVFEHGFAMFFLLEIIIRLMLDGKAYIQIVSNWFDIIIVVVSLLDLFLFQDVDSQVVNLTFLRLFRLVRLMKIFRVFRVMSIFKQLRLLVISISSSMGALGWCAVLLAIIQLISAIFMSQLLSGWLRDDNNDIEIRNIVFSYFGTFSRAWITMFQITVAPGGWSYIGRILMYEVNRLYSLFFIGYVSFVTFAIIRVITAMFLKETLATANRDLELVIQEKMDDKDRLNASLKRLQEEMDAGNDGFVTWEDLDTMCQDRRAVAWLHSLNLSVQEVNTLFELLVNDEGKCSWHDFISGVKKYRGNVKGIDVATLQREHEKVLHKIKELKKYLHTLHDNGIVSNSTQNSVNAKFHSNSS